ncbi:hypothetical protein [Achromobacter aloeverae]
MGSSLWVPRLADGWPRFQRFQAAFLYLFQIGNSFGRNIHGEFDAEFLQKTKHPAHLYRLFAVFDFASKNMSYPCAARQVVQTYSLAFADCTEDKAKVRNAENGFVHHSNPENEPIGSIFGVSLVGDLKNRCNRIYFQEEEALKDKKDVIASFFEASKAINMRCTRDISLLNGARGTGKGGDLDLEASLVRPPGGAQAAVRRQDQDALVVVAQAWRMVR